MPSPPATSDTDLINHNLVITRENLEAIEAQLERATTVVVKLDETLKNLKIATEQVNTNLEVIDKAAEITSGAVERS
jgi:methyl-accepting chemotaxis protein